MALQTLFLHEWTHTTLLTSPNWPKFYPCSDPVRPPLSVVVIWIQVGHGALNLVKAFVSCCYSKLMNAMYFLSLACCVVHFFCFYHMDELNGCIAPCMDELHTINKRWTYNHMITIFTQVTKTFDHYMCTSLHALAMLIGYMPHKHSRLNCWVGSAKSKWL